MKIVQINATCGQGSTGKIVQSVSVLLQNAGIENYIFYSCNQSNFDNGIRYASGTSIKLHALISRILGNYGFDNKIATRTLISHLKKIRPDIIHIHNLHSHDCDLTMLFDYIRESGIKVYWTFHDCWTFTGYCPYFDAAGCDKWKTQCHNCPQMRKFSWIFDRSKSNFRKKAELFQKVDVEIITPSQWLADLVQQSCLKGCSVRVINNGIDLSLFCPRQSDFRKKYHCEDKYIILGVASTMGTRKGIQAFIKLAETLPEHYQIVLVGTTKKIEAQLPKRVLTFRRTENQIKLAEIYSAADLVVNPTMEENYPTVNMESIACGTPVLTYNTGGSGEMVDETCGSVVPKGDFDALYQEILRISETKPYSREGCVEKAKQFSAEKKFKEYIELYHDYICTREM